MSQVAQDQEIVTEEIRVHVQRKPACRIEMQVKTNAQLVKEARKNAIKAVSKEVILPGFRKGRAPEELVQKKFPADVEKQMHKALADLSFVAAQKEAKIPVLNNNSTVSFELKSQSKEGAEVLFSFETEPTVSLIDISSFQKKPVERPEVAEKQIDEAIRQMRFFYAQWKQVQDRPIQDGDYIMIDLDTVEGEVVQPVFHHIRFEVSKERMAQWMKKLVEGAKAGDVLHGVSEPDETASEEEKKEYTKKNIRLTILKVEEAYLPEVDDDFAKKVGAPDTVKMRESITHLLNKQADDKVLTELREQVNDFLLEQTPFEIPQSLIDTEKKHRLSQLMQNPKTKADWNKMSQAERKTLEENIAQESRQAVRLFYISRHIVQEAKIPITHQEVQNEAVSMAQSGPHIQGDEIPKELFALALSKVILAKAQDFVLRGETKKLDLREERPL